MKNLIVPALMLVSLATSSSADSFFDDFSNGPSGFWGNEIGGWTAPGGTYGATAPGNLPNASSGLPFAIGDGSLEADVIGATDGGFWLRSGHFPGSVIGRVGMLLVMNHGTLYWHKVFTGAEYGSSLNVVPGAYASGSNVHVKVTVTGSLYACYLNGSATPATTYTTTSFPEGQFALYDYVISGFDNVQVQGIMPISCWGQVALMDTTLPAEGKTANWQVRRTNGSIVDSGDVTLGVNGAFTFPSYRMVGMYEITTKVSHWLRESTAGLSFNDDIMGLQFSPINGDVDDDNEIGPGDFGALSSAFGSVDGDGNWNLNADLDEDGEVGPSDFGILSANFGLAGD